jgi:hypothetical protein
VLHPQIEGRVVNTLRGNLRVMVDKQAFLARAFSDLCYCFLISKAF